MYIAKLLANRYVFIRIFFDIIDNKIFLPKWQKKNDNIVYEQAF